MKQFNSFNIFRTIKSKQLALAVLVSVIPLILLGYLVIQVSIETIRTKVRSELRQITGDKAQSIDQWISERKADIHLLASTNIVKSLFASDDFESRKTEFHNFYDRFAEQYGVYRQIFIIDTEDKLFDSYPTLIDLDTSSFDNHEPGSDQSVISDAYLWEGKPHISISSQIIGDDNILLGKVVVITSLEDLNNVTNDIRVGETGEAYLINSSGCFVTHKNQSLILTDNYFQVEPFARILSGKEESFVGAFIDYRGIEVLGSYFYIKDVGWSLVAEQDVEEAFAPAIDLNNVILLWILVTSVIAGLAAFFMTTRNLKPLSTLQEIIGKIRQGALETRFPVRQRDEIGITGEVFNSMLEQLQQAQEKLKQKIDAADRELIAAHCELQTRHRQLKKTQDRLLLTEKLSTMGEVAAGLAHEINNPLATILLLIESLLSYEDISKKQLKDLAIIQEEVKKIASMISRFMDLTLPHAMRFDPIIIDRVFDKSLALLWPKLKKERVEVEVEIDKELPVVLGDESQLGQMVMNLMLNSIYAMPYGGDITINVVSHCRNENKTRYLRITMIDTGHGISEDIVDRIFNPFFTTRADGTGLGLSIVSRIVENHDGMIRVLSTPGVGATFIIDLPESKE